MKDYSSLQHDYQQKCLQLQRMVEEQSSQKKDYENKENKINQLRFENDRLFNELTIFKNTTMLNQVNISETKGNSETLLE